MPAARLSSLIAGESHGGADGKSTRRPCHLLFMLFQSEGDISELLTFLILVRQAGVFLVYPGSCLYTHQRVEL